MATRRAKSEMIFFSKNRRKKSAWTITVNFAMDKQQFAIIDAIIRSLRAIEDNYLIVELRNWIGTLSYIQVRMVNRNKYLLEVHFEKPCFFFYHFQSRLGAHNHPWTQYKRYVKTPEEVTAIFRRVLCYRKLPNLRKWTDCTRAIYLEGLRREQSQ